VASFAQDSYGRVLTVAALVGLVVAIAAAVLCSNGCFPVVTTAVNRLPAQGEVQDGRLHWPTTNAVTLAENPYLALSVDPTGRANFGQSTDVRVVFGPKAWEVSSMFGYVSFSYPPGYILALNRTETQPWWTTLQPYVLVGGVLAAVAGLLLFWALLGLVLMLPVSFYTLLIDRKASLGECWRLSVAALMPGAVLMAVNVLLYGVARVGLVTFLVLGILHVLVDLVYLLAAPLRLPQCDAAKLFQAPVQAELFPPEATGGPTPRPGSPAPSSGSSTPGKKP
jgi:hypothetical protein